MSQIKTRFITDLAVDVDKLNTDAVSEPKILNSAVTESKIANGAVTTNKIGADAVDSSKIADNSIGNEHLQDNAVTNVEFRAVNNAFIRARNAAGNGDVSILKVNASDAIEFASFPEKSGTPSSDNQLVNKSYVDGLLSGLKWKASVKAASTGNLALSGGATLTVDGISLANSDRLLLKNQSSGAENGIYVVSGIGTAYSLTRSLDADSALELVAAAVFVEQGSVNADKGFVQTADSITLETTPLVFVQFSATASSVAAKENITLIAGDITNQYVDLAQLIEANTLSLSVAGVMQYEGFDYTLSTQGGVTRLTFAGGLATGGDEALIATDILRIMYRY